MKRAGGRSGASLSMLGQMLRDVDPALAELDSEQFAQLLAKAQTPPVPPPNGGRWQDALIVQQIPAGASVLDLGCGEGQLLCKLMREKAVRGQGIELDAQAVFACLQRGVPVFQADLDEGLKGFPDQSFDYVVLEETVQTLHRPTDVLQEVLRVGRHGIISFPNFGHWRVRLGLALKGLMPRTETLPYQWYDTPNIHLLTLADFMQWAGKWGAQVVEARVLVEGQIRTLQEHDNLWAEEALLVIQKA